jgi:hypothetical protein
MTSAIVNLSPLQQASLNHLHKNSVHWKLVAQKHLRPTTHKNIVWTDQIAETKLQITISQKRETLEYLQ